MSDKTCPARTLAQFSLLVGFLTTLPVHAEHLESAWALRAFAQQPRVQRNRVPAAQLATDIDALLLSVVNGGARGCACGPRRLRWVWALPRPSDALHPSLVVAFEDRPRAHAQILVYERLAQLIFKDGAYVVSGVLTLNRPLPSANASLSVQMLPRRDLDLDGQLDLAIRFAEIFPGRAECGRLLFQSGSLKPLLEPVACPVSD